MSGSNYYNCDLCGKGKILFDANVDWEAYGQGIGQVRITCKECYESGHRIEIFKKGKTSKRKLINLAINRGVHRHTFGERALNEYYE